MQRAAFSILSYKFPLVHVILDNHKSKELSLSFNTSGKYVSHNSTFELSFFVSVFTEEEKEEPFVKIQCDGVFKFENVNSFSDIPDFFYKNSIAILFPYVRAYISLVTTQANVPGVILPTLNLSNLEDELKKNTQEKL